MNLFHATVCTSHDRKIGDVCFDSVTNVGNRPTFGADSFAIESHMLNFHPIELTAETPDETHIL